VIDFMVPNEKFRYAAEQRIFCGRSGELNSLTAEVQRNLSVCRTHHLKKERVLMLRAGIAA
jgi:hypothetical protein